MPTRRIFTLVFLMYAGLRLSEGLIHQAARRWTQQPGVAGVAGEVVDMSLGR